MPEIFPIPPLILHPFSSGAAEDSLAGVRAALALQRMIDSDEEDFIVYQRMLTGRYQEVRMLIFLGKDLFRWLRQAVEHVMSGANPDPRIAEQSFAALVVEDPPDSVRRKLEVWGVSDRRTVFSRAIGIHSLFQDPPPADSLSPVFLENYHRYADHAYICFQHLKAFLPLDVRYFPFEIFASEEYSKMLSNQWNSET